VYHHAEKDQDVLISLSEWDTQKDADEYWDAFTTYAVNRWGSNYQNENNSYSWKLDGQSVLIKRQANQVLWVVAPESSLAEELSDQFSSFE